MSAPTLKECYGPPHVMGRATVRGGVSCATCYFVLSRRDGPNCGNACWINTPKERGGGGGDSRLPVYDPKEFFCDLWEKSDFTKAVKDRVDTVIAKSVKR